MAAIPILLQHVRELALLHVADAERARVALLTPFPPEGPDFPDFEPAALTFADVPPDGETASNDTVRAYEFARRADAIYYDYSYGLRSEDYRLTELCERFYRSARFPDEAIEARARFDRKAAAFLQYRRSTAGDLGRLEFCYAAPTPIAWRSETTTIAGSELERLRAKAIAVYQDVQQAQLEPSALLTALIDGLRVQSLQSISYEFGYFDVIREWLDPSLFDRPEWSYPDGSRRLYGDGAPEFEPHAVRLAYAQRYYVARRIAVVDAPQHKAPLPPPKIRLHAEAPARSTMRRLLTARQLARVSTAPAAIAPDATAAAVTAIRPTRTGFVWVEAAGAVPAHWERARAPASPTVPAPTAPTASYLVTAVRCRVLPSGD